ncbi:MAG: aminotransferase class V-fold PLP-dependent enzyme [Spirochaetales bacterium]|nr:aminotransferase class V-fold PLP-dependent enzyme [Spirochaetales bacterium]
MENKRIYLDHNATTPLHPEVEKELQDCFKIFGNPSSMHTFGRQAREKIEKVRHETASLVNAEADEIIFMGSGSEANNTVLNLLHCRGNLCRGIAFSRSSLITTSIEHPCIMNASRCLTQHSIKTIFLKVDEYGKVDLEELESVISDKTGIVSVMLANNEIGTIQDIKTITRIAHEHGALMHTDAVQAVGKIPVDVRDLDIDFLTFSAHKFYGPKGIGVLYVKKGTPYCPFIHGGHQETGRRAGTENTLGIIGLGKAVEMAKQEMDDIEKRVFFLKEKFKAGILERIPDVRLNGHPSDSLPQTLNVSFFGAEGESILLYLDMEGIAVSTGSACASGSLDPSHVLLATGLGAELAHGSIRFSFGRGNTEADVDYVLDKLPRVIERIRGMSTVYKGGRK